MGDRIADIVMALRAGHRQIDIAADLDVAQPYVSRIKAVMRAVTEDGREVPNNVSERTCESVRRAMALPAPDSVEAPRSVRHDEDTKAAARALVNRGHSPRDVAAMLGASRASVMRWTK